MKETNNEYMQQLQAAANNVTGSPYGNSMQNIAGNRMTAAAMHMNQVNATRRAPVTSLLGAVQNAAQSPKVVDPNKDPAMSMELDALVDLFTVRYGTAWVEVMPARDDFWRMAANRLAQCRRVETYQSWVRIIPNKTKEDDGNN